MNTGIIQIYGYYITFDSNDPFTILCLPLCLPLSLSLLKASHAHHTVLLDKFSCILICVCVLRINLYSLSIPRYKQLLSSLSFHMNLLLESSLPLKLAQNFRSKLWHHMYLNKQRTYQLSVSFTLYIRNLCESEPSMIHTSVDLDASRRVADEHRVYLVKKTKGIWAFDRKSSEAAMSKAYRRNKLQSRLMAKLITDGVPRTVAQQCTAAGISVTCFSCPLLRPARSSRW